MCMHNSNTACTSASLSSKRQKLSCLDDTEEINSTTTDEVVILFLITIIIASNCRSYHLLKEKVHPLTQNQGYRYTHSYKPQYYMHTYLTSACLDFTFTSNKTENSSSPLS